MSSESSWIDFTAGWISGGVSTLAIQPIDTILTRLQANASVTATSQATTAAVGGSEGVATLRPANIFRGMISNFGIASLWRGSSAMIGAVPVQNAVLMTGYGFGKRWSGFDDDDTDNEHNNNSNNTSNVLLGVFMGGTVGGILQSFVMSPIEQIKVSQQVIGKSVSAATSSVLSGLVPANSASTSSSGGGGSLAWRGLGATLLRDGIPHGVWFVSYEYAKVELTRMRSNRTYFEKGDGPPPTTTTTEDEIAIPMLSGAFAAFTAWGVGYPFDLIKTRIQAGKSTGIIATAREIVRESPDGRACYGLYRGFGLKLLRSIPASAIGFLVYETVAKALSSRG